MHLLLKQYQQETIARLAEYCQVVRAAMPDNTQWPEAVGFKTVTGRNYYAPPGFEGVPYVCLRLPTGGGKTLLGAHAVGTVARQLLHTDSPVCLWICPSTTIRDQTLRLLRDKPTDGHYRALRDALGPDVAVITLEDALMQARLVAGRTPLVIVTTIQSYRIKDEHSGEEIQANRRIYRDDGYLQAAFEDVPALLRGTLRRDDSGLLNLSLANALMLRKLMVVMDEAHNARTPTSFESLARFGPSCVIELTATPQHEHDPARDLYASNVLHAVSALQLKNEGMIKLPIDLENRGDWLEVLAAAKQRVYELQKKADEYENEGGPPIRPIALIQAEPKRANKETHHAEVVKQALIERLDVPAKEVRICTGSIDEIGDEDLMSPASEVRFIITVEKLREGWDCPFAYVLGSIGNAATPTAVEQLLGRIMRQPYALPTRMPALDRAYAFVLSDNVTHTAMQLRDRMVETCGFDAHAASEALRVRAMQSQPELAFGRIQMTEAPALSELPRPLQEKINYEPESRTLEVSGTITEQEAKALRAAAANDGDRAAVESYWQEQRPVGSTARPLDRIAEPVRVPWLALRIGDRRTIFEPEELDEFTWDLNACPSELGREQFADGVRVGSGAEIDVQGEAIITRSVGEVRLRQLELIGEGDDWSQVALALWLDSELHRGESFSGLAKSQSQPWMARVVERLVRERKFSLPVVVRRRHELSNLLRQRIAEHGRKQVRLAAETLIKTRPEAVETSPLFVFELRESKYAPTETFERHQFRRHAFEMVGKMNQGETECATRIDSQEGVRRWVRNLESESRGAFFLPLSPGRFFPDFIVEMNDGVIVLVEYKMRKMESDPLEQHKKAVGELWAARSNGRCRFGWVAEGDWGALEAAIAAQS